MAAEPLIGPVVLAAVSVPALVASDWRHWRAGRFLFKPLSALAFLWFAVNAGALETGYGRWLFAGLLASACGDLLLMPEHRATFLAGLVAFLCGHLLYGVAFTTLGPGVAGTVVGAVPAIALAVLSTRWLLPHLDDVMKRPVLAYILVIAGMLICAAGTWPQPIAFLVVTGAWGFALSDLAVARQQFVSKSKLNPLWGTPLYFGSQMLLAASVLAL
jgi:uncharacterized membrane protein YhhN